jgi:hypothetical protein
MALTLLFISPLAVTLYLCCALYLFPSGTICSRI